MAFALNKAIIQPDLIIGTQEKSWTVEYPSISDTKTFEISGTAVFMRISETLVMLLGTFRVDTSDYLDTEYLPIFWYWNDDSDCTGYGSALSKVIKNKNWLYLGGSLIDIGIYNSSTNYNTFGELMSHEV